MLAAQNFYPLKTTQKLVLLINKILHPLRNNGQVSRLTKTQILAKPDRHSLSLCIKVKTNSIFRQLFRGKILILFLNRRLLDKNMMIMKLVSQMRTHTETKMMRRKMTSSTKTLKTQMDFRLTKVSNPKNCPQKP